MVRQYNVRIIEVITVSVVSNTRDSFPWMWMTKSASVRQHIIFCHFVRTSLSKGLSNIVSCHFVSDTIDFAKTINVSNQIFVHFSHIWCVSECTCWLIIQLLFRGQINVDCFFTVGDNNFFSFTRAFIFATAVIVKCVKCFCICTFICDNIRLFVNIIL